MHVFHLHFYWKCLVVLISVCCFFQILTLSCKWSITTSFVPVSFQFPSSLLPFYFHSTSSLLPVYFQSFFSLLPVYFQSTSILLLVYFQSTSSFDLTSRGTLMCQIFDFLWNYYKLMRYTVWTNKDIIDNPLCNVEKTIVYLQIVLRKGSLMFTFVILCIFFKTYIILNSFTFLLKVFSSFDFLHVFFSNLDIFMLESFTSWC